MSATILPAPQEQALRRHLRRCEPFYDHAPDCWSIAWMRAAAAWQVTTWPPGEVLTCLSGPPPANTNVTPRPAA